MKDEKDGRRSGFVLLWPVVLLFAAFLPGCSSGNEEQPDALLVASAISLKEAMEEMGRSFEATYQAPVSFNFAGSNLLQRQIESGAPADVFASAASGPMDALESRQLILPETRRDFAANTLALIGPVSSPPVVHSFEDLVSEEARRIAIGSPDVPVRLYSEEALKHLGLWDRLQPKLVFGQNARQVLEYVARGEVDAGLVYRTDASANPDVTVLAEADTAWHSPIAYPIAVLADRPNTAVAARFVDFVTGAAGRQILTRHGFGLPAGASISAAEP